MDNQEKTDKTIQTKLTLVIFALVALCAALPLSAQQKGQYVPGQWGLNAGVVPDPGITYEEITINYSATQLNNANGGVVPGITGTYSFWGKPFATAVAREFGWNAQVSHQNVGRICAPNILLAPRHVRDQSRLVTTNCTPRPVAAPNAHACTRSLG